MVERVGVKGRKTFYRRSFTDEQCKSLLELASPDRRVAYHLALSAGMRRGEIEKLEWGDIQLEGNDAHIMMRACTTKNKKSFKMPLLLDLLATLKEYAQGKNPHGIVLSRVLRLRDMQKDWKAAGIPLYDEDGRKADFHALRMTFCSRLMAAGVNPKEVQLLMRHSDARLTMQIYTDAGVFDLRGILGRLEPLRPEICSAICSATGVRKGEKESFSVQMAKNEKPAETVGNEEEVLKSP